MEEKAYKEINEEFIKMVNYDYDTDLIEKNIGDEKRTFNMMNKSIPLLSPTRCLKWLNEHIWWSIPQKNLVKPRLFGQIVHLSIELYFKIGEITIFDTNNIVGWIKGDMDIYDSWTNEQKEKFVKDLNIAIEKIIAELKKEKITILSSEKHIANDTFHGFVDMIGWKTYNGSRQKKPIIIDLKTTTQPRIKPEHILQLAIYKKIMKDIPATYILFYNTNENECNLIPIFNRQINDYYKKIMSVITLFRKKD